MQNIAVRIDKQAEKFPNKIAVKAPKGNDYESLTFKELVKKSKNLAYNLSSRGLKKGDKALVFIRPGLDFPIITFALFRLGVVPIFIDPGMGKENLLRAIESAKPDALISVWEVHLMSLLYKDTFKSIKYFYTNANFSFGRMKSIRTWYEGENNFKEADITPDEMAAILFTSGGTGIPKGVIYTHKIFNTQTDILKELFSLTEYDVDIPGFPLFAFFTMAMGMTSCIPDMNPSKPGKADPKKLVKNILDNKGTFVAGSPAIWEKVAKYCTENNITLPSVKYLVMFGAPVSPDIHRMFQKVLPNGTTHTPYGATESLPVSNVEGSFLLAKTVSKTEQGLGTCVGKPAPGIEISIINITDEIIEDISLAEVFPTGKMGEIIVKGDVATKEYFEMPKKTAEAKIKDGESFWHRMGDIGYIDEEGYLWFCGRKTHRVETTTKLKSSIQCEAIFNTHQGVKRSALIGLGDKGNQIPAIVIERSNKSIARDSLKKELLENASKHELTKDIKNLYFHDSFPVDVRHNIKIDRLKLAQMAEQGQLQ